MTNILKVSLLLLGLFLLLEEKWIEAVLSFCAAYAIFYRYRKK